MIADRDTFRNVIGHFTAGVTVVTARHQGTDYALTASAVASLSLDPPMLVICVNRQASSCPAIAASRRFAVNILQENQGSLAMQFAKPGAGADKFAGVAVARGAAEIALLSGALAHIECRVVNSIDGGSHTVFLAEVERAEAFPGSPLAYFRGKFGRFEPAAP